MHCLLVTGGPLDEGLRTALYLAACKLIRNGEESAKFKDENGEGGVWTKHKRKSVSSFMAGIEFFATVDSRDGTMRCRFLVDDVEIPANDEEFFENGYRWIPLSSRPSSADEEGEEWKRNG